MFVLAQINLSFGLLIVQVISTKVAAGEIANIGNQSGYCAPGVEKLPSSAYTHSSAEMIKVTMLLADQAARLILDNYLGIKVDELLPPSTAGAAPAPASTPAPAAAAPVFVPLVLDTEGETVEVGLRQQQEDAESEEDVDFAMDAITSSTEGALLGQLANSGTLVIFVTNMPVAYGVVSVFQF